MDNLTEILIFIGAILLFTVGIYLGEMNMKRIAIERGVAYINRAGKFEFKQGSIEIRPCKPDGSC